MTPDQAATMADHLTRDFRGYGPGRPTWLRVLDPLDFDRSFIAYMALLGAISEKPAVAEFMREYEITAPAKPKAPKVACKRCDGEGWRSVKFDALHMRYDGVVPCDCAAGRRYDAVHRSIVKHNEDQSWHTPTDACTTGSATHAQNEEF